jgi:hypothetical protein
LCFRMRVQGGIPFDSVDDPHVMHLAPVPTTLARQLVSLAINCCARNRVRVDVHAKVSSAVRISVSHTHTHSRCASCAVLQSLGWDVVAGNGLQHRRWTLELAGLQRSVRAAHERSQITRVDDMTPAMGRGTQCAPTPWKTWQPGRG